MWRDEFGRLDWHLPRNFVYPALGQSALPVNDMRGAVMPLSVSALALAVHLLHIGCAGWGTELQSAFPRSDAAVYLHNAWYAAFVAADGGFAGEIIHVSPYVGLQTLAYRLFGAGVWVPFAVNALLASLAAAFSAWSARTLFGLREGWATGVIVALCGPLVFFAGLTVKTSLVACLLALGMFAGISFFSRGRAAWLFVAVLALGVAALDRNNLALLVPWLAAVSLLKAGRAYGARGLVRPGIAIAGAGALLLIVAAWDMGQLEQRAFSPLGLNFYVGNAPGSWGGYTKVPGVHDDLIGHHTDAVTIAEKASGRSLTRWEVSRYWFHRSLDYYRQYPGEYAVLQLRKLGLLVAQGAQGDPEQYRAWRWQRPALWLAIVDVGVVLALGAVGLVLLGRRLREGPIIFLLISAVLYSLSVWLFFINERYRISLVILVAPFAGYGLARIIDVSGWRRRFMLMTAAGVLWVGSYALTELVPPGSGWASDPGQAARDERLRLARELPIYQLKEKAARDPALEDWLKLSEKYERRGFFPDAQVFAEKAIALAPTKALGYQRLYDVLRKHGEGSWREDLTVRLERVTPASRQERLRIEAIKQHLAVTPAEKNGGMRNVQ